MPEIISPLFAPQAEDRLKVLSNVHIRAWKICKGRPWKCHLKEREMQKEERGLEVYAIKYYCGRMHWPPTSSFWNLKHKEQTKSQLHFTWSLKLMITTALTRDLKNKVRRQWCETTVSLVNLVVPRALLWILCCADFLSWGDRNISKSRIFFPNFLLIQLVLGRRPHQGKVPCISGLSTGFTV